jgi:hypothetical protein
MADDKGIRRFIRIILDRESASKAAKEIEATLERAGQVGGREFARELKNELDHRLAELRGWVGGSSV